MNIEKLKTADLVIIWNSVNDRAIKKFSDRETAIKRCKKLLSDVTVLEKAADKIESLGASLEAVSMLMMAVPLDEQEEEVVEQEEEVVEPVEEVVEQENEATTMYFESNEQAPPIFEAKRKKYKFNDVDAARESASQRHQVSGKFTGRKSKMAGSCFKISGFVKEFRAGTCIEHSYNLIKNNPMITYKDFRIAGGRNNDLKAFLDKGLVIEIK